MDLTIRYRRFTVRQISETSGQRVMRDYYAAWFPEHPESGEAVGKTLEDAVENLYNKEGP